MAPKTEAQQTASQLPALAATRADIGRLIRELETIEASLLDHNLRKSAGEPKKLATGQLMDQAVELNKLDLLQKTDRQQLRHFLQDVKEHAPLLHISFGIEPSAEFLDKLVTWLRQEIHPRILLSVGLQPTIGAGCIVRSTNRIFDFSLRQKFAQQRELLVSQLMPASGSAEGLKHE